MEPSSAPFVPFFLGLVVSAGVLVPLLLRLRALVGDARSEKEAAGQQITALRRANAQLEEDLRFLTQFLKDYPRLARELYSGLAERQIPGVLLSIVQRSLDPEQVVVLVRRSESKIEPGQGRRLVVAASYPEGVVPLGTEHPLDAGEIGFAGETQMVVSRQDLEGETASGRIRPAPPLPGLARPDVIAPLVFDQDTLGVILVQSPRRTGDPKAALRLVAQSGAQVLHSAAQVTRMKLTAEMDGLTRVFNKKHLEQTLNDLVYRAACAAYDQRVAGPEQTLSVFLFDIDNFKHYNDTNGHLAGDRLLQQLSRLVSDTVRKDDVFGRFGGEEFLLVLPHTDATQAMAAAEKIRNLIASHPFPFAEKQPLQRLSVSGGVAEYPSHGLDSAGILHAADEALYEAKRAGRNRVLRARPASPAAASSRA